jgi:hypothetical protein
MFKSIPALLTSLKRDTTFDYKNGEALYRAGRCQVLSHSTHSYDVLITDETEDDTEAAIHEKE